MNKAFLKTASLISLKRLILMRLNILNTLHVTSVNSWPYVAIFIAHFIWGTNFVVAKLALQEIPPMSLGFLRFVLAVLLFAPFLLTAGEKIKINKKDLPALFSIGLLMITFNIAFFYEGLLRTSASHASVLTMVIPLFSVLLGWWFLKEKVYVVNVVGILIGLLGAIFIIGLPLIVLGLQNISQTLIGNTLIILASLTWVLGATLSKKMEANYSPLLITFFIFVVGAISFFIPAANEYFQNPEWPSKVTHIGLLGLVYIAIASSVSAYFLFEWGLNKLGVIKADLFQYIQPLIATTLAIFILGENLRFSFLIGATLIGLGVYWGTWAKAHHKQHKAHKN